MALTKIIFLILLTLISLVCCENSQPRIKYEPNWNSLDQRPLPAWYDEAKIGIFIHWGVYSVPSFGSEWFWTDWKNLKYQNYVDFMKKYYKPDFAYQDFAKDFTAELFNATQWALLFKDSGAKYVVLTSKHHDGFALWPSQESFSWNAMDIGPKRDILKELSSALRQYTDLKFGLYYSLFEWFNRMYIDDKLHIFLTQNFVDHKVRPEQTQLILEYLPEILWSDGDWEAPAKYWKSEEFIAWLYNDSPVRDTIVTNDRWGFGTSCMHGDFYNCKDRFNPGKLISHKWENAFTIDKSSWGQRFDSTLADYMTSKEIIDNLVTTVSCNGNVLINVGPTKYGTILPIFEERLRDMGHWLKVNGEAIYSSKPWIYQNDSFTPGVWYTCKSFDRGDLSKGPGEKLGVYVYAIVLNYPYDKNELTVYPMGQKMNSSAKILVTGLDFIEFDSNDIWSSEVTEIVLLGMKETRIEWYKNGNAIFIAFPPKHLMDKQGLNFAWTFRITISK